MEALVARRPDTVDHHHTVDPRHDDSERPDAEHSQHREGDEVDDTTEAEIDVHVMCSRVTTLSTNIYRPAHNVWGWDGTLIE